MVVELPVLVVKAQDPISLPAAPSSTEKPKVKYVKTRFLHFIAIAHYFICPFSSKFINDVGGAFARAEAMLKVVLSPLETVVETFIALLQPPDSQEFSDVLEIKVACF